MGEIAFSADEFGCAGTPPVIPSERSESRDPHPQQQIDAEHAEGTARAERRAESVDSPPRPAEAPRTEQDRGATTG